MSGSNAEIVRAVIGTFDGVNVAAIDWDDERVREALGAAYSPDLELFTLETGIGTGIAGHYEGMDDFVRYLREWFEPFSEFYIDNLEFIELGDTVIVPSRQWGIGHGSGIRVELDITTTYRLEDGLLTRVDQFNTVEEARKAIALRATGSA